MYNPGYESLVDLVQAEVNESRGYAAGQERSLLVAVLGDGLQALFAPRNKRNARRIQEAKAWIDLHDSEYIFSFDNVCEALGIDADNLRSALGRAMAALQAVEKI